MTIAAEAVKASQLRRCSRKSARLPVSKIYQLSSWPIETVCAGECRELQQNNQRGLSRFGPRGVWILQAAVDTIAIVDPHTARLLPGSTAMSPARGHVR